MMRSRRFVCICLLMLLVLVLALASGSSAKAGFTGSRIPSGLSVGFLQGTAGSDDGSASEPTTFTITTLMIQEASDKDSRSLLATVQAHGHPTGRVAFKDGDTAVAEVELDASGHATLTVSADRVFEAPHAVYLGDGSHNGSDSLQNSVTSPDSPAATFSPSAVSFGSQGVGTTAAAQTVLVTNPGTSPLSITGISIGGANPADFSIASKTCGKTVAAGASCKVLVTFSPHGTGPSNATLTFVDNAPGSPQDVPLAGVGVNGPFAALTPSSVSFGTIAVGVQFTSPVAIVNTGNAPLTFASILLTGTTEFKRTTTCPLNSPIAPGAKCKITITVKASSVGIKSATLTLSDNAADSPQVVNIAATAIDAPFIRMKPAPAQLGTVLVGTTGSPLPVSLTNIGDRPLHIAGFTVAGTAASEYSATPTGCSVVIAPKAACSVSIAFSPALVGTRLATLMVDSDALINPFVLTLRGTGSTNANGVISPTALSFGAQPLSSTSSPKTVTISNTGTAAFSVLSVSLGGTNLGDFTATPNGCSSIAPGSSCTISVVFRPTGVGARTATLTVLTNANALPKVNLSGTGTSGPVVSFSAPSVDFGSNPVGQTTTPQPVTLSNTGTAPLTITSIGMGGANPTDFAQTNNCPLSPATLASGKNCTITLTFTAAAVGPRTATLAVADNAPGNPHSVPLTGTGGGPGILVTLPASLFTFDQVSGTVTISDPAPAGGQQVFLSSNNSTLASVDGSVTVAQGQTTSSTFHVTTNSQTGGAVITAFATGFANGTANISVTPRQINLGTIPSLVGIGRSFTSTPSLLQPAPQSGTTVALAISNPSLAAISVNSMTFPANSTTGTPYQVTGLLSGTTSITASAPGYATATSPLKVTNQLITLGKNVTVAPGQTLPLPISLSSAAATPVIISFVSSNSAVLPAPANITIAAGQTVPSPLPQITGASLGSATITASDTSNTFGQDSAAVTVGYKLTFSPTTLAVLTFNQSTITLNLSAPAAAGGYTATLSVDDATIATVPPSITIPPGGSSVGISVSGVNVGSTTLHATGAGASSTSATINVGPAPAIILNGVTVGKDLEAPTAGSLAAPAPAGNLALTIKSNDPTRILLSPDATTPGQPSIVVQASAGSSSIPSFFVQAVGSPGAATIKATAVGYAPSTATVTVVRSGFYIASPTSISTAPGLPDSPLAVSPAALDVNTLAIVAQPQPVRPGVSVSVPVTSSQPTVGTITTTPLAFTGGESVASTAFHPLTSGTTTITAGTPTGFSTPGTQAQLAATVSTSVISVPSPLVLGDALQTLVGNVTLSAPAPSGNLDIAITSADPTKLLLSTNPTAQGSATLTLQVSAGSQSVPTFYVQSVPAGGGGHPSGTVNVQLQATGFGSGTIPVSFVPTGFTVFAGCFQNSIATTNISTDTPFYVVLAGLDPNTLQPSLTNGYPGCGTASQTLSPGFAPVSVSVSSDTPAVGTVSAAGQSAGSTVTVQFGTNDASQPAAFHPVSIGSATLSLDTPTGFSTPAAGQQITATVTGSNIFLFAPPTGKNLESTVSVSLATPAPPGNEQVRITSSDPAKVLLSTDPAQIGTAFVDVIVFAGSSSPSVSIYAQALAGPDSATLTAEAPDYGTISVAMPLVRSGFVISAPYPACWSAIFSTPYFAPDSTLSVFSGPLDPTTSALAVDPSFCGASSQALRPGIPAVDVAISSSNLAFGTVTSPVTFNGGDAQQTVVFHPVSVGSTMIALATPAGFTTPSNNQDVNADVTNGGIFLSIADTGNNLESAASVSLSTAAPAGGTVITLTSGDSSKLLLSTDPLSAGSGSVSVPVEAFSGSSSTPIYAQARSGSGSVTVTASASGYDSASIEVNLVPSGVILAPAYPLCASSVVAFSTTPISPEQVLNVYTVPLDPVTLNYTGYGFGFCPNLTQPVRPDVGPFTVAITSSNMGTGTITASPLTFSTGDSLQQTTFQPQAIGTSTIALGTPSATGFSLPSNFQQIIATVEKPTVSLNSSPIGSNLQDSLSVSLSVAAPAGGEQVTLTSADQNRLLLSADPNQVGAKTLNVTIPAGNVSPLTPIYAQALAGSGSVNVSATASGFDPASYDLPLVPSGFIVTTSGCATAVTTSVLSGDTQLNVFPAPLDPITRNAVVVNFFGNCPPSPLQAIRPGIVGPVSVTLSSNVTGVGTVTASPLVFQPNDTTQTSSFHPVANGTTTVSISTPSGFSPPSNYQQITFTVADASINAGDVNLGRNMEVPYSLSLGAPAPAGGVSVTIASLDGSKLQFSTDPALSGSASLTLNVASGSFSVDPFYVQAKSASTGDVSFTVHAVGYASTTATAHILPSGFAIVGVPASFNTTVDAADTTLQITPVALDPAFLSALDFETLTPGLTSRSVNVLTSKSCGGNEDKSVGEITLSPVVFDGADVPNYKITSFHPNATGSTVIYVPAPLGYSQASNFNCVTANVN